VASAQPREKSDLQGVMTLTTMEIVLDMYRKDTVKNLQISTLPCKECVQNLVASANPPVLEFLKALPRKMEN